MNKKCVIVNDLNGKPLQILEVRVFTKPEDFISFQNECAENYSNLLIELKAKEEKIAKLEKDLKLVQLELAYNRGDLSEEEYLNESNNCN